MVLDNNQKSNPKLQTPSVWQFRILQSRRFTPENKYKTSTSLVRQGLDEVSVSDEPDCNVTQKIRG
jgi:hypothetical protein